MKINNFGLSAKLQYGLTDALRGEVNVGYDFKDKEIGMFNAALNFHYLINVGEKFKIYPIVGIGYGHLSFGVWEDLADMGEEYSKSYGYDEDEENEGKPSKSKFLVNAGAGAEYAITEKLSIGAEVKYQYVKDFSRLPINIGFTYKF